MYFNSIVFAIFFVLVFGLYWFVLQKRLKLQNALLLISSYVFYGWWDYRFLSLIIISSLVDFLVGMKMQESQKRTNKRVLLAISLVVNLGLLFFFKYFNFFTDSLVSAFSGIGIDLNRPGLDIVLPVGISFYTFQTLSYTIDIYRGKMEATRSWLAFFSYVAFFPQLVAGPIERAHHLLPQFSKSRVFDYDLARSGMKLILWGLFKKVVLADNCATVVDLVFSDPSVYSSPELAVGVVFFAFQIYGDFSGYSDMAIGLSRLLGFDLMRNFAYPYFSRDISEFWRRWHISLSTWFRDYVYIPLGGSKGTKSFVLRNVWIIFLVSGLWHGANWTFILWGAVHAMMYSVQLLRRKTRTFTGQVAENRFLPRISEFANMAGTFAVVCFAWIFFRAENISSAFIYIERLFSFQTFTMHVNVWPFAVIVLTVLMEWIGRKHWQPLVFPKLPFWLRWIIYMVVVFMIIAFEPEDLRSFIYFQF